MPGFYHCLHVRIILSNCGMLTVLWPDGGLVSGFVAIAQLSVPHCNASSSTAGLDQSFMAMSILLVVELTVLHKSATQSYLRSMQKFWTAFGCKNDSLSTKVFALYLSNHSSIGQQQRHMVTVARAAIAADIAECHTHLDDAMMYLGMARTEGSVEAFSKLSSGFEAFHEGCAGLLNELTFINDAMQQYAMPPIHECLC